jgi:putative alpha-1,2-mannosidase
MSAWYVLASIGFHPICQGDGRYEICGSQFGNVRIKLPGNRIFEINTLRNRPQDVAIHMARPRTPDEIYIQSATLNGKSYTKSWISHANIMKGGRLELFVGPTPNKAWGLN